jgi:hypothetical protein
MDTLTLRILETITSNMGDPLSINQLTERIKETYGSAYYANVHQKLQELKNEGTLTLEQIGRSSNIKLNFQNYLLIDTLAEMEIEKKRNFLTNRNELFSLLTEMDKALNGKCEIQSISAINLSKNIKLNKIELLILLRETSNYHKTTIEVCREMLKLQNKHNVKINNLIVNGQDFLELTTSNEINPVREALSEKIVFYGPQSFWSEIREIAQKTEIKTIGQKTKPASISQLDLMYNLNRLGYKEFGHQFTQGKNFCIEYVVTAILLQEDTRLTEAIPVVLAKNTFKSSVLAFLNQKYDTSGRLLGLLKILQNIKPTQENADTIELLETFNVKEIHADKESLMQKLRLYNVL